MVTTMYNAFDSRFHLSMGNSNIKSCKNLGLDAIIFRYNQQRWIIAKSQNQYILLN